MAETETETVKSETKEVDVHSKIDEKIVQEFKNNVIDIHGKINTGYKIELTTAIVEYNQKKRNEKNKSSSKSKSPKMSDQISKIGKRRKDVQRRLYVIATSMSTLDSYPQMTLSSIRSIIKETIGVMDPRTEIQYTKMVVDFCSEISQEFGSVPKFDVSTFVSTMKSVGPEGL